jgi:hypothetical protein
VLSSVQYEKDGLNGQGVQFVRGAANPGLGHRFMFIVVPIGHCVTGLHSMGYIVLDGQ